MEEKCQEGREVDTEKEEGHVLVSKVSCGAIAGTCAIPEVMLKRGE